MTPPSNPKLDVKADEYYSLVRQRMEIQADEKVRKAELIEMLKELGVMSYETPDGVVIERKEEEKLTAKKKKEESGTDAEEEDEDDEE